MTGIILEQVFFGQGKGNYFFYLWHAKPQLGIEVNIVVPGENVRRGELGLRQAHHLGKACPSTAIEVGHSQRSDDGNASGTLDHHRSTVETGVADALAGIWS